MRSSSSMVRIGIAGSGSVGNSARIDWMSLTISAVVFIGPPETAAWDRVEACRWLDLSGVESGAED
jgi:hypothetical protein